MLLKFYRWLYHFILTRRYKITIKGLDLVKQDVPKLILPNHQSHLDPQLISVITVKHTKIVPVVSERFFKVPVVKFFVKKWESIPVSDFRRGNRDLNVIKKITTGVTAAFKRGRSVVIFPSGQLSKDGTEKIRNKQSAYAVVSEMPDNVRVIGVRITGLWGSIWSKAWSGKVPVFHIEFIKAILILYANLIFFSPKRKITIEFVDITEEAKKQVKTDRKTFNNFLEEFYNLNGPDKINFVRHFFYLPLSKKRRKKNSSKYKLYE